MEKNEIRYSCADFSFPLLSHDKALKLIKLLGINAVDLGIFEDRSHLFPSYIIENPISKGKRLSQQLKRIGLEAADVFLQTGAEPRTAAANDPDRSVRIKNREIFMKMLDFANTIGSDHLTGLPGVIHDGEESRNDWQRACEETCWRIEKAKAADVVYAVEAHVGSILPDAEKALRFINDCPGLTLTLDYGHFIYQGQTNESIHPLIPYASHFHARGGAKGKLQTIVRENEIDFKTILSRFREIGYSGFICMEYVYQDWEGCNRTDNISETILLHELLKKIRFSMSFS